MEKDGKEVPVVTYGEELERSGWRRWHRGLKMGLGTWLLGSGKGASSHKSVTARLEVSSRRMTITIAVKWIDRQAIT